MPYPAMKDPGWIRVQEQIAEALAPIAAVLGARECEHGDWSDCDAQDGNGCLFDSTRPKAGSMSVIAEFVLVANLQNMGNEGEVETVVIAAPNMRNTNTKGLLHVALYE